MNPDDLARILDELGQRLGPTGEYVFALAVRQVYIDAALTLAGTTVLMLAMVCITVWAARFTRRHWASEVQAYADGKGRWSSIRSRPDADGYVMTWLLGGLLAGFLFVLVFVAWVSAMSRLLNPEYAALRDILGAIGGAR